MPRPPPLLHPPAHDAHGEANSAGIEGNSAGIEGTQAPHLAPASFEYGSSGGSTGTFDFLSVRARGGRQAYTPRNPPTIPYWRSKALCWPTEPEIGF